MRKSGILFILVFIFLTLAYLAFRIFVYEGTLIVENIEPPFEINFSNYGKLSCEEKPCIFEIPPKKYLVTLNKTGYLQASDTIKIPLRKEKIWNPRLKKIPTITEIDEAIDAFGEKIFPPASVGNNPFSIREDGVVFFIDTKTGNLYQENNDEKNLIAQFQDISTVKIYSDKNSVFLLTNKNLFEILMDKKRKFKIFSENNLKKLKIDKGNVFLSTTEKIFLRPKDKQGFVKLSKNFDVDLVCTTKDGQFIILESKDFDDFTNITFWKLNSEDWQFDEIANSNKFENIQKIYCESENSILMLSVYGKIYRFEF